MINFSSLTNRLSTISNVKRRLILIFIDIFLILASFFTTFYLKFGDKTFAFFQKSIPLALSAIILGVPFYIFTGQYKALTRYVGSKNIYLVALRNFVLLTLIYLISLISNLYIGGGSTFVLIWFVLTIFIATNRLILRDLLLKNLVKGSKANNYIIIYGARSNGARLLSSLRINNQYKILGLIDESPELFGRNIYGIPIYSPEKLIELAPKIDQIFLSEHIQNSKTKNIFKKITKQKNINISEVFSIEELALNNTKSKPIESIDIEDLLGREGVFPQKELLAKGVKDKIILVTGAGGSIGSEICRILITLKPQKIILFEINEACLYEIDQELNKKNNFDVIIKSYLGSTLDERLLNEIFNDNKINIVFHAAAYKHVPIVENNFLQGIYNNCFSTKITCQIAKKYSVEKYILISTDKAVRPTNIMGASKRVSEMIVQGFASEIKESKNEFMTIFSMVRFGNVIGSSGSVIPLFKKQIAEGGPITITHREIERYFMTIKEASELVIQSSALAKGGDLFLLDMGSPVKIYDLAKNMIKICGLNLKDKDNPDGDIEIIDTGLRPGEKLYEELLINSKAISTSHKLIYTAQEKVISNSKLWPLINNLELLIRKGDKTNVLKLLKVIVPEWNPSFRE